MKGSYQFICYGRFDERDKIIVAINNGDENIEVDIPVWQMGVTREYRLARLIQTTAQGFSTETRIYPVENGNIHLNCPPKSGRIIKNIG